MPLSLATEPLTKIFHTRPPVSFTRPVRTKNILADKIQLFDVSAEFKSQDHAKTMRNLMKSEEEDSYGEECWYSGSCVRVVEDLVIFSGNDGSLKVAKLLEDERKVFNKVPGDVAQISDKKLEFSRILSLDIQSEGKSEILVSARHRWGVGIFCISEVADEGQVIRRVQRIPCSEGSIDLQILSPSSGGGVAGDHVREVVGAAGHRSQACTSRWERNQDWNWFSCVRMFS